MKLRRATIHSYWLMFVATVITVAIVTSSQLITDRIGLLLDRQASELLAADMVVISGREFDAEYREVAKQHGLRVSSSVSMRTAIFIDDNPRLVELKAVVCQRHSRQR
jgi:putative ABC transport system permease protein